METRILNAGTHALEIEKRLYDGLKSTCSGSGRRRSGGAARALAEIDLAAALAELAVAENWCEPVVDDSRAFDVQGGRHPVVERALRRQGGGPFVANDCALTPGETPAIWLLTGPNMAGKSTFLRQNALIALLAQAGSYRAGDACRVWGLSASFSAGSVRRTIWRAGGRPSWSRWSRRRRS